MCCINKKLQKPAPLTLYGKELPWVASGLHLGQTLHESGTMEQDSRVKRATFIQESTDIRETFSFANPVEVLRAVKVFASSWYGSMLWEFKGIMVKQVFNAWSTCVKLAWHVPRQTHTYFVDHMLGCGISSVKTDMLAQYVGFIQSLRSSPSMEVRTMVSMVARDLRTSTGRNLDFVSGETGLKPWSCTSKQVRAAMEDKLAAVPDQDGWRLPFLGKLLSLRGEHYYQCMDTTRLTEQIESLCVN